MKIVNANARSMFSGPGTCCWCGRIGSTETAHVFSRGSGGPDHAINLVPLCKTCHWNSHSCQRPDQSDLLPIISLRDGWDIARIVEIVYALRRTPKEAPHYGGLLAICGHEQPVNLTTDIDLVGCPLCAEILRRMEEMQ